jgi:hypothetical protein
VDPVRSPDGCDEEDAMGILEEKLRRDMGLRGMRPAKSREK